MRNFIFMLFALVLLFSVDVQAFTEIDQHDQVEQVVCDIDNVVSLGAAFIVDNHAVFYRQTEHIVYSSPILLIETKPVLLIDNYREVYGLSRPSELDKNSILKLLSTQGLYADDFTNYLSVYGIAYPSVK